MKGRNKFSTGIENLDAYEADDEGFIDGDINLGTTVAAFSFGGDAHKAQPASAVKHEPSLFKSSLKGTGLTPSIDGEAFSIKRGYQFRTSTLRKLAELKARHSDINVYINTILDEAINHYYNYVIKEQRR